MPKHTGSASRVIFLGGVLAGSLDILLNILYWTGFKGVPAFRILQSVATGLLGRPSFNGGYSTAALGLFLHFFIAISLAYMYFFLTRPVAAVRERPWLFGPVYGGLVYLAMMYIVIPFSAATPRSADPRWVLTNIVSHLLLVGVPIALAARNAGRRALVAH